VPAAGALDLHPSITGIWVSIRRSMQAF
jgi:hypothetical protein